MSRRATFFDDASWKPGTRLESTRLGAHYCRAAHRGGMDDIRPEIGWLADFLCGIRRAKNANVARRYARAIRYHMISHGAPDLTADQRIEAVLFCDDSVDPLSIDFDHSDVPLRFRLRARALSDTGYATGTLVQHDLWCKRYLARCAQLGVDDPLHPPEDLLPAWFEEYGRDHRPNSVRNMRSGISRYFREHRVADASRTPRCDRVLDGIRRSKPPIPIAPTTPSERLALFQAQPAEGLGLRNRVILHLLAFTKMSANEIALVKTSDCVFRSDGVLVRCADPGFGSDVFVGTHEHPDLDILRHLPRLIKLVGDGPLFQGVDKTTLHFNGHALQPVAVAHAVTRVAKIADVSRAGLERRLKMLFDSEITSAEGSIVAAHHFGLSRLRRTKSAKQRAAMIATRSVSAR